MTSENCGKGDGGVGNGGVRDMCECSSLRSSSMQMRSVKFDEGLNVCLFTVGDEEARGGRIGDALPGLGEDCVREGCCKCGESGETASFEAREIQQVSSILMRAEGGRLRS